MAKIAFSKLNQIKKLSPVTHQFGEYEIEVEQYLPLEEKVSLMTRVIEQAGNGEEGFFNIVKLDAYYRIEMIQAYTNISFTDKQLEDTTKLFDGIILNKVWDFIEDKIPEAEREYIWNNILNLAREITTYNNSILGVIKTMTGEQMAASLDWNKILESLRNPEEMSLLKEMVKKTGLIT